MMATFAVLLVVPRLLGDRSPLMRLVALALAGGAGGMLFLLHSRQCLAGPFGTLDPIVYKLWYRTVGEGMPVWTQPLDVAILIPLQWLVGLIGTAFAHPV